VCRADAVCRCSPGFQLEAQAAQGFHMAKRELTVTRTYRFLHYLYDPLLSKPLLVSVMVTVEVKNRKWTGRVEDHPNLRNRHNLNCLPHYFRFLQLAPTVRLTTTLWTTDRGWTQGGCDSA